MREQMERNDFVLIVEINESATRNHREVDGPQLVCA
jgi:hypothetical protein